MTPEDIKAVGADVLRHRMIMTYEAEAENVTSEDIVARIFGLYAGAVRSRQVDK